MDEDKFSAFLWDGRQMAVFYTPGSFLWIGDQLG